MGCSLTGCIRKNSTLHWFTDDLKSMIRINSSAFHEIIYVKFIEMLVINENDMMIWYDIIWYDMIWSCIKYTYFLSVQYMMCAFFPETVIWKSCLHQDPQRSAGCVEALAELAATSLAPPQKKTNDSTMASDINDLHCNSRNEWWMILLMEEIPNNHLGCIKH